MYLSLAHTSTILATGSGNPSVGIGPKNILWNVVTSLYTAFNNLFLTFGFDIPEFLIFVGGLLAILMLWSFVGAVRNRRSFSLEDEPDTPALPEAEVSG